MPTSCRWTPDSIDQRASWDGLCREQAGVLSRAQLSQFGVTRHVVSANVAAGRWRRVLPRVFATFTGDLSREAWLCAALLYGGSYALLSHRTAAEEWGLLEVQPGTPVEITVPYNCSAVAQANVRVHRSRAIGHIGYPSDPPRTRRTDTILDLAVSAATPQQSRDVIVDLVGRSAVSVAQMLNCVAVRAPRRHRAAIESGLELVGAGVMSVLEARYWELVEDAHSLPRARRQVPFEVDGRSLWEDCTYDHVGAALTVRLDGRRFHSTPGVAFRDRRRDNAAELAGRARLTYGWDDVNSDPCGVAREVYAVLLRSDGYAGPDLATCGRECCGRF